MTHIVHYICAYSPKFMLDYDLRIVYDSIMQIVSQTDATTITQPKYPDVCDSALHLFAAPTQLVNVSPIGSAADANEDKA